MFYVASEREEDKCFGIVVRRPPKKALGHMDLIVLEAMGMTTTKTKDKDWWDGDQKRYVVLKTNCIVLFFKNARKTFL